VCHEHGLDADPARTADVASILRVPETFNFKVDPPLNVSVILPAPATDFETFKAALGGSLDEIPDYAVGQINELTRALMGNKQHRFSTIMLKIEKGNGCKQLEDAIKNRETLEEPRWRAALSIPAFCVDSATGIHEVSLGHPDYSPEGTQQKITKIKGPYTCDAFERINPGGCEGCPHKDKINSPITLGQEIIEAAPEDNVVEYTAADASKPVTYTIPEYPFPYFRGRRGGVYIKSKDEGDDPILVYEHDLYVVKRMKDPQNGEVIWMRLHTPKDGIKEFALPAVDLLTADKLREKLAWFGVIAMKKQMELIMGYIVKFTKELQYREGADIMRTQFGWTDKNKSFVVGDTDICADGDRYIPPSS
jgi:hypothetical protein